MVVRSYNCENFEKCCVMKLPKERGSGGRGGKKCSAQYHKLLLTINQNKAQIDLEWKIRPSMKGIIISIRYCGIAKFHQFQMV